MTNGYADVRTAEGGSLQAGKGYHDIPGLPGNVYRSGSQARAEHVASHVDVAGLCGVDIGCSVGGLSFALTGLGARMVGYDYDASAIDLANRVATERDADCRFVHADLTDRGTWDDIFAADHDFAVWMSQWMWLARQAGRDVAGSYLAGLSKSIPTLVFETSQGDGAAPTAGIATADDVKALLETVTDYTSVVDIGPGDGWLGSRHVFVCRR